MLELFIAELQDDDYRSRMPDVAARKRIEKKYFELTREKISWEPEISNKIGYLRKLWIINGQLVDRTGVAVVNGQIDMAQTWWADRIVVIFYLCHIKHVLVYKKTLQLFSMCCLSEYGAKEKFVSVLQKKPLPFKDLLDQIFGEHDVDQDERFSPHTLGLHLQNSQLTLGSNDVTVLDQIEEEQSV
ncbi:unnamed protein product [Cochlearia groenlandica]